MPLLTTKGTASASGLGFSSSSGPVNYIEEVFSTYLYTGNGSTQTVTNNIDLSTKGGLTWIKQRDGGFNYSHILVDSTRGVNKYLSSNNTAAQVTEPTPPISAFNTTGFSLAAPTSTGAANTSTVNYASWTFRKQPKFFDIVTYTGNGSAPRNIAHNLGSVPGCIMIKRTDTTSTWTVYHVGIGNTKALFLNADSPAGAGSGYWNNTTPTSAVFTLGGTFSDINASGGTYVAYLFAHDAGGFGLTGNDNVISCGSYSGNGGNNTITLGYEPQWLMVKETTVGDANSYWAINDNMRNGITANGNVLQLQANSSSAEDALGGVTTGPRATATGFQYVAGTLAAYNASGSNYIYIAIRRPMKVPTTGTSVFSPVAYTGSNAIRTITAGFPVDADINMVRSSGSGKPFVSRLTNGRDLDTTTNGVESTNYLTYLGFDNQTGLAFKDATGYSYYNSNANTYIAHMFRRAPRFFDQVCYTGTGSATTFAHNLTVVPELMIVKPRANANTEWNVYAAPLGPTKYLYLHLTNAVGTGTNRWNDTAPTSSVFTVATDTSVNGSGYALVAYLFATCPGVSKVGSYTGTGTTLQVNCGFTAGARYVLIKRTDSTGDWYVWDTARGIISGNDPYLLLNTSGTAEVTNTDYIDPINSGFEISSTAPAEINANGGTYIFLAIA